MSRKPRQSGTFSSTSFFARVRTISVHSNALGAASMRRRALAGSLCTLAASSASVSSTPNTSWSLRVAPSQRVFPASVCICSALTSSRRMVRSTAGGKEARTLSSSSQVAHSPHASLRRCSSASAVLLSCTFFCTSKGKSARPASPRMPSVSCTASTYCSFFLAPLMRRLPANAFMSSLVIWLRMVESDMSSSTTL